MIKVKEEETTVIKRYHKFFCDDCGKKLGKSIEYDDGYVPTPCEIKNFEYEMHIGPFRCHIDKMLCKKCNWERTKKLAYTLMDLGWEVNG